MVACGKTANDTPAATATPTVATPTAASTPTEEPATPTPEPTAVPTEVPATPTPEPTAVPTEVPATATPEPTAIPTEAPATPTPEPTAIPTEVPATPTVEPTLEPTAVPTEGVSEAKAATYDKAKKNAVSALTKRLNDERSVVYVYHDFGVTENHFTQRAKMYGIDGDLVVEMNEDWQENPYSGSSCIRCEQLIKLQDWGGWLMLNGYLPAGATTPQLNKGDQPGQGLDLTGANEFHFFARGENGGEVVEFFVAGFGYNGTTDAQTVIYPDSTTKKSAGWVKLTKEWKEYVIPLDGFDMSYIVCGFGYVLNDAKSGVGNTVFYLDEMYYSGKIRSALNAPVMLRSYDTDNKYISNAAFSYDNALVAMAFISEGKKEEAKVIVDAFRYAINNDRVLLQNGSSGQAKRVRNAYAAGDISAFPGWEVGARLPGWYERDTYSWFEDSYQCGSNVGNTSYVAMALLQYYRAYGGKEYLQTACELMDWVLANCQKSGDGFTAGFDGWEESDPQVLTTYTYKSIEHNIDAYAVFAALAELTGKSEYAKAAESSLKLIRSLYNENDRLFYTGTGNDGKTPNKDVIVLDAQVWCALSLGELFKPYEDALKLVDSMKTKEGAYPFCRSNKNGGWWAEGTAFTALLFRERGEWDKYEQAMDALVSLQSKGGLFPAASVKHLSTGIYLADGSPWEYSDDRHIAPTAWFIMAVNDFNPYDLTD